MKRSLPLLAAVLGLLLLAAPASAEKVTKTYRYGPVTIGPYQVKQNDIAFDITKPTEDAYITDMSVDVVDPDGSPVPISRIMLHHIVFFNLGDSFNKSEPTCNTITMLDNKSKLPMWAERFYGAGEERNVMKMPNGYGYLSKGSDKWGMTWMLMNHRNRTDTGFIEYKVTYETNPLKAVKPVWLDQKNCLSDPIFDVRGGGRKGSVYKRTYDFRMPEAGRIVVGGGHLHGGGLRDYISQPDCGDRKLIETKPTWGSASHPFYSVRPILHEPGPVHMSGTLSEQGFPVAAGQKLRLNTEYDGELPHTRVMGIMLIYYSPDGGVSGCQPLPTDAVSDFGSVKGRTRTPVFKVPITLPGRDGIARAVKRPPGRTVRLRSGSRIVAKDFSYSRTNIELPVGGRLTWSFPEPESLHNVTLANGPQGFSSVHLNGGRTYTKKFTKAGTYQLFCQLHPVDMVEQVVVKKRRR